MRAGEVVGAVRVQDAAVVVDFKEEVLHHAARESKIVVPHEAQDDEVAIPAVHLVEHATRHHIRIGKIEQPRPQPGAVKLADTMDRDRQPLNVHLTSGL